MTNKLCTETFDLKNPDSLKTYLDKQGYQAWKILLQSKLLSQKLSKR